MGEEYNSVLSIPTSPVRFTISADTDISAKGKYRQIYRSICTTQLHVHYSLVQGCQTCFSSGATSNIFNRKRAGPL